MRRFSVLLVAVALLAGCGLVDDETLMGPGRSWHTPAASPTNPTPTLEAMLLVAGYSKESMQSSQHGPAD